MEKPFLKLVPGIVFLFLSFNSLSQNSYRNYLNSAIEKMDAGEYDSAINFLLKAKALNGLDSGYNGYADMYLGNIYELLEKTGESIVCYHNATSWFETKSDDFRSLAYLYNHLGNIELNFVKRFEKALGYYRKQMHYDLLGSDSTDLFNCYINIGLTYKELKQFDSALSYFNVVLVNNSLKNKSKRRALLLIGDTYTLQEKFSDAEYYYDEAIKQLIAVNDSVGIFMAYLNKGDCLSKQEKYKSTLFYLTKAQQFINDSTYDNVKKVLYYNLADAYRYTGDLEKALNYKYLESDIKDSIDVQSINQAAARATAEADAKYGTQIAKLESAADKRKLYIALIGVAIICLIAFLALRNASLRKKANAVLAAQKAKVEALAADLEEANQTKARLFSVISHDLRSPVSSLYASLRMQELKGGNEGGNGAVSSQIMHLLDTLEDLLTWSKSQMDRFTLQPVTLRIADMYADLIELHHDAAASKQITIVNKAERQVKIYTDENLLKTILRNVLANSIHHAPNKSTVLVDAAAYENGVVCTISNEATATDAAMLESRLQTAAIGSSKHGLGNVLIKEFTEKLQADFELTYADGKVYLQIKVPALQKASQSLVLIN